MTNGLTIEFMPNLDNPHSYILTAFKNVWQDTGVIQIDMVLRVDITSDVADWENTEHEEMLFIVGETIAQLVAQRNPDQPIASIRETVARMVAGTETVTPS